MNRTISGKGVRVLVTGAAGFVGQHVLVALAHRGYDVRAVQHRREVPPLIRAQCGDVLSGDICQPEVQREAVRNVDVICHLAAYIPLRFEDSREGDLCYRVNALSTLSLATAAVERGVERFIFTSTGNMYSPSNKPATERDMVFPTGRATYYFVSKLAGEVYLAHVAPNAIILRLGAPYGLGEPEQNVVATFMRRAAQGEPLHVLHGGAPMYNLVYVENVANCVVSAVERGQPGIYNVASGEQTSLRRLAEGVARVYEDRDVDICIDPPSEHPPTGFTAMSIEKARRTLEFAPLDLLEGLRQYRLALSKKAGRP